MYYMYPNKNKPNNFVPVVDRNSIHGSSNMSDTNDEEPFNSPDFAHQRPSNRWIKRWMRDDGTILF